MFKLVGIDLAKFFNFFVKFPGYIKDFIIFNKQKKIYGGFKYAKPIPILHEKKSEAGVLSGQYFHQDLYVAQKIFKNNPIKHLDIGSRIDGFVAHVASFRDIEILDIRHQESKVSNIKFRQLDLMSENIELENYCDSMSCLHAIEHFGLGRYGDNIDFNGHIKALKNMSKILKTGGKFYFSTPIGPQTIQFNAHRIFSVKYLKDIFDENYTIDKFSYINDSGDIVINAEMSEENINNNFNCNHGCGIFEMTKK